MEYFLRIFKNMLHESNAGSERVKTTLENVTNSNLVTEYEKQTITEGIECNETLDVIRSLPEFSGQNLNSYVSWREAAHNSISL